MSESCNRLTVLRRTGLSVAAAAALAMPPLTGLAQSGGVTVIVNGQTMSFDQPPIVRNGRVFVPLRGVFEQLGASVVYANGQINATGNGRTISLTIGSTQATVNGQSQILDVAPFLVGSRTLVPLRFIAQSLGATVDWNDSTSTVTITGGNAGRPQQPPPERRPIVLTYQWPTGTIYNHYPQLRFNLNRRLAMGSFRVILDGNDVTSNVASNGQYYYVNAPFSLQMGKHRVRVTGQAMGGAPFDLGWTFNQGSY
ncbi:MAG TPA: copper amine oxidase N-terminal domain-containing protein [Candidatus Baltobacteraceae bacterium]|nr:copper amine oxidase N-terminal domain-containing protein [Candidatus Baltobacteraceae bacterium]